MHGDLNDLDRLREPLGLRFAEKPPFPWYVAWGKITCYASHHAMA
jgi:hypothetical protein